MASRIFIRRFAKAAPVDFGCSASNTSTPPSLNVTKYRIVRMDDNGHKFEVGTAKTREEAEATIQAIIGKNSHQHKQVFWVDEII
jgi:hypothetical protein